MKNIPIFDSLTHPMPNGNWIHPQYDNKNTIDILKSNMKSSNIRWAIACGMGPEIGGYNETSYCDYVSTDSPNIFPIAFIDISYLKNLPFNQKNDYFKSLVKKGYVGVKLHPRFSNFNYAESDLELIINLCKKNKLTIFLCTYIWGKGCASKSTPELLMSLLEKVVINNPKIILVHGGGVRLLEYIEIARAFNNVLLDLSLTLCKYEGSSIDLDMKFAFQSFDRRICIGSDGPEFDSAKLRERFDFFSNGLDDDKKINIAYKNLFNHIELLMDKMHEQT